jgi:predicted flavoprotein YhiN
LDGVRAKCRVTLLAEQNKSAANKTTGLATSNVQNSAVVSMQASSPIASEMGELLFRKQAVSGIAIFNLSRKAKPGDILSIDLFPDYSVKDLCHFLTELYESYQTNVSAAALLQGIMHPRLAALIIRMAITDNVAALDKSQIGLLVAQAKDFRLTVKALPAANQAQLASGGIALTDLSSTNLEFLTIPGLFAAGECIDIDAPCGGYNLHWAWASGLLAGKSAACFVKRTFC